MTGDSGRGPPPAVPAAATGGRWADLSRRLASTAVLLAMGIALAVSTGIWLRAITSVIVGITFWELARMTVRSRAGTQGTWPASWHAAALGALSGLTLMAAMTWFANLAVLLVLPILVGLPFVRPPERLAFAIFGLAILLVGDGLVYLREALGLGAVLWVMGVVIISDTLGYFAGRLIGGPKFWPRLSPKKTWSGTVAGWVGAAIFGAVLALLANGGPSLIWLSPLVAFAGQMGDLAESWLKRRAGVKDSSDLIPGHGGLMDRFDAVSGAVLAVAAMNLAGLLPIAGAG